MKKISYGKFYLTNKMITKLEVWALSKLIYGENCIYYYNFVKISIHLNKLWKAITATIKTW